MEYTNTNMGYKIKDITKIVIGFFALPMISLMVVIFGVPSTTYAVQTVPYLMNFQGRLTDASGNPVANGLYNMKFAFYDAATSGTLKWSETRETTSRVQVTNGLFSIRLGEGSNTFGGSLGTVIPANMTLYLDITEATPATANCSTASCATWESPLTPRSQLATSAYAFNSDTLDGLDSTAFAAATGSTGYIQNATGSQTADFNITGTGKVGTALVTPIIRPVADSSTALRIQNAAGTVTLMTFDTSTPQVVVGSLTNGISFSANGLSYYGTAQRTYSVTLSPEYAGATFTPDGADNTGTLSSDFCSGSSRLSKNTTVCAATVTHNYYQWTTASATPQDYDVYVRYQMPTDYETGTIANMAIWGWGTNTTNEQVTVALYSDASGTACSTSSNAVTGAAAWAQATVASPLGACTIVAGDVVTFKVRLRAGTGNYARAGEISFALKNKF